MENRKAATGPTPILQILHHLWIGGTRVVSRWSGSAARRCSHTHAPYLDLCKICKIEKKPQDGVGKTMLHPDVRCVGFGGRSYTTPPIMTVRRLVRGRRLAGSSRRASQSPRPRADRDRRARSRRRAAASSCARRRPWRSYPFRRDVSRDKRLPDLHLVGLVRLGVDLLDPTLDFTTGRPRHQRLPRFCLLSMRCTRSWSFLSSR